MESPEFGIIVLIASLLVVAALAVPVVAIAVHRHNRRSHERAAGLRRKDKIRL